MQTCGVPSPPLALKILSEKKKGKLASGDDWLTLFRVFLLSCLCSERERENLGVGGFYCLLPEGDTKESTGHEKRKKKRFGFSQFGGKRFFKKKLWYFRLLLLKIISTENLIPMIRISLKLNSFLGLIFLMLTRTLTSDHKSKFKMDMVWFVGHDICIVFKIKNKKILY